MALCDLFPRFQRTCTRLDLHFDFRLDEFRPLGGLPSMCSSSMTLEVCLPRLLGSKTD